MTSWIIRDPSGTPIAQRYANGQEYYSLFDGQGDVVGLEDPGQMQASYDYCPTGNEADLSGGTNPVTTVGLGNPSRQGAVPYDDGTKDYLSGDGTITERNLSMGLRHGASDISESPPLWWLLPAG